MASQQKLPYFPFYAGDWMKDTSLRSVSIAARGLWFEMLCLMHESERRGFLQINGKPPTLEQLARMTGCSTEEASRCLLELETALVFSTTNDGIIYSRRMKRDEEKRRNAIKNGKLGGNPKLKEGVNPRDKENETPIVHSSVSKKHTLRAREFSESSIDGAESIFSPSYETVLSVYREITGARGTDTNTKAGARTLAQAMDAGELTEKEAHTVIRNGLKDERLPNQSLRGIANNWGKYLPAKKDDGQHVFYECEKCGMIHKRRWVSGMPDSYIGGGGGCDCGGRITRTKG